MRGTNTRLLTCRYWALGPKCPNVTVNGDHCDFAHYDTGRLASHIDQRGTCQWWLKRQCTKARNCFYEHRHTGVPGLYQGVLELDGFEFEVAETASKAGFDTLNHAALFDLIWDTKRVVINTARPTRTQPYKNSIYPDRYRPSGIGDNTRKKRKAASDRKPPQFYPVQPLNHRALKEEETNLDISGLGTQTDPICLDQDHNNRELVIRSTKRRKLSTGQLSKPVSEQPSQILVNRQRDEPKLRSATNVKQETRTKDTVTTIRGDLTSVGKKLEEIRRIMVVYQKTAADCRHTLKQMYDQAGNTFDNNIAMKMLEILAHNVNQVEHGAEAGVSEIKKIVSWITDSDDMNEIL